jgi:hypothetical protein
MEGGASPFSICKQSVNKRLELSERLFIDRIPALLEYDMQDKACAA